MIDKSKNLIASWDEKRQNLEQEIELLTKELDRLETENFAFENYLRSNLEQEIIEEQELTILYKAQKKAKKEKRLAQKNKSKKKSKELLKASLEKKIKPKVESNNSSDSKEKKRLYREAMLQVHPDKFSMKEEALATEVTSRLIEIYQKEDLETLKTYHAHIFSGNSPLDIKDSKDISLNYGMEYLLKQKQELETDLADLKQKHTYIVWTTYSDPYSFLGELKAYYEDRLFKLRKRTRKGS